MTWKVTDNQ